MHSYFCLMCCQVEKNPALSLKNQQNMWHTNTEDHLRWEHKMNGSDIDIIMRKERSMDLSFDE